MKPGFGHGTYSITFCSNQLDAARLGQLVDLVGLRLVSIGPPISVIEAGRQGSSAAAMQRGGGQHRHRGLADGDDVGVGADAADEVDDVVDEVVEVEAPGQAGMSRASRQSVM